MYTWTLLIRRKVQVYSRILNVENYSYSPSRYNRHWFRPFVKAVKWNHVGSDQQTRQSTSLKIIER